MTPEELIRARGGGNPLTAFFDADPAGWKPFIYSDFRDLGVVVDSQASIVIATQFQPFVWTHVVWTFVGNIYDPETSGLYNDGMVNVTLADERTNYLSGPTPMNIAFGPHMQGEFAELPLPIFFPANHAINLSMTNLWTRTLTPESDTFRVHVAFKGLHYWGKLQPSESLLAMSQGR